MTNSTGCTFCPSDSVPSCYSTVHTIMHNTSQGVPDLINTSNTSCSTSMSCMSTVISDVFMVLKLMNQTEAMRRWSRSNNNPSLVNSNRNSHNLSSRNNPIPGTISGTTTISIIEYKYQCNNLVKLCSSISQCTNAAKSE